MPSILGELKARAKGRVIREARRLVNATRDAALRDGNLHPSAVLYPTASVLMQGRPKENITVGAHCHIRGELLVFGHGGRITMGDWCYVGEQTRIWSATSISIGNRVLISHLVTIMDNLTHPEDPAARHAQFRAIVESGFPTDDDLGEKPVVIEDDVLIGGHSLILRGVTIGRGAIVGAGSVVTKDVAPMTIVAGNPARYVRDVVEADRGM
jgi:acetyltransferase-like isoleucine patch superfamily enzyme